MLVHEVTKSHGTFDSTSYMQRTNTAQQCRAPTFPTSVAGLRKANAGALFSMVQKVERSMLHAILLLKPLGFPLDCIDQ